VKRCNSCRGGGGVIVNEDMSIDVEVCMRCDGYGWAIEDENDYRVPKMRKDTQDRRGD
jgi:DnaJ-class molecular chaperone